MATNVEFAGERPAIAGGSPIFPEGLRLVRPSIPDRQKISSSLSLILESGVLTNGPFVKELELAVADYLGVRHCVAVSSCTAGLMLILKASGLSGEVVVPSFTFAATAHAVAWNGLKPVFADIEGQTLTLSAEATLDVMGNETSAILATHTFGTPCDVDGLKELADRQGVQLFFDAAHAFGSKARGVPVGSFGHAEVFSLSPTKVLIAGEGGIISTNDDVLAERCRIGRDYANPGDYDCVFVGLNARMSEIHAAIALQSLDGIDDRIRVRNELVIRYKEGLSKVPGIAFPEVRSGDLSTFKDFTILVDDGDFGLPASKLAEALAAEGIDTRHYYSPPVHRMKAYASDDSTPSRLPVTDEVVTRVLTLPLSSEMNESEVDGVITAFERIASGFAARR